MFVGDPGLRIGTSSWSSRDWVGPFYPAGTRPERFIEHYATVYDTVEIDATFYRMPTAANVKAWHSRTGPGFAFAVKTPRVITHDKVLVDAGGDMRQFLDAIGELGDRLGPVLLQFPYFNKRAFEDKRFFFDRLADFLGGLPAGFRYAVEVRNRAWIKPSLKDLCAAHGVALAWIDQAWMPGAGQWPDLTGGPGSDFAYIRWLGDRKAIEKLTTTWDRPVIDRSGALQQWAEVVIELRRQELEVYGYFNNHFAGHAPSSAELFRQLYARASNRGE